MQDTRGSGLISASAVYLGLHLTAAAKRKTSEQAAIDGMRGGSALNADHGYAAAASNHEPCPERS